MCDCFVCGNCLTCGANGVHPGAILCLPSLGNVIEMVSDCLGMVRKALCD